MKQKNFHKKKILVLDLDETLVHASATFPYYKSGKPVVNTYQLDLYVENNPCTFYISERPYVHLFMAKVCEWYQVIIFTASVKAYADPVIDRLDRNHLIKERLFRESCATQDGIFIKDLSIITDDLSKCVIIDNSPLSYAWQPENAIPIESWLATRESDEELLHLLPFLDALRYVQDCRNVLSLRLQNQHSGIM